MALNLKNLPKLDALLESDMILVQTTEGIKAIPSPEFGVAVSSTSLFETYTRSNISVLSTEKITTSTKIQRYLQGDTSDEVYIEVNQNVVEFKKGTVYYSNSIPQTQHMTGMSGQLLYWSDNPSTSEFSNGLPWKTPDGKKVFIGYEETEWPVMAYRYLETTLKSTQIQDITGEEPVIQETYKSGADNLRGIIMKSQDEFIFKLTSSLGDCGLKLIRGNNGDLSGELIGIWAGLNDEDPSRRITKDNLKQVWYNDQDLYSYLIAQKFDTSDKIGWYLNSDITNKVFFKSDGNIMTFYLAVPRINPSTGVNMKEQARNIFNQLLYWKQDMSNNVGITNNNIPLKSGSFAYMTAEETDWPVWIWQYDLTKLMEFSYDSTSGIKQSFTDASGNKAEIYKTSTGLKLTYKRSNTENTSEVILGENGGTLKGGWNVQPFDGTPFNLQALPQLDTTYVVLSPDDNGNVSVTLDNNQAFVLNQTGDINITVTIPNVNNGQVIQSNLIVLDNTATVTWSQNVIGQDTSVDSTGVTEFLLRAYKGVNTSVYLRKTVY